MIDHRGGHSFDDVFRYRSWSRSPKVLGGDILHGSLRHKLATGIYCISPRVGRHDKPIAQAVADYIIVGRGRHTEAGVIG